MKSAFAADAATARQPSLITSEGWPAEP